MSHLVLFDNSGKVTRTFEGDGETLLIFQDSTTGRVQVASNEDQLESLTGNYDVIKKLTASELRENPVFIGSLGRLAFIDKIENVALDKIELSQSTDDDNSWKVVLAITFALFFGFMLLIKNVPRMTNKIEQDLKTKVVKIREIAPKPKPVVSKVKVKPRINQISENAKSKQNVGIKRMGALSALGQMTTGKLAGLNLGAVETRRGPGLGGLQGSGGTQANIYAKGMVSAPLGAGNNLAGAGGYGTKGRGGGQAGFGEVKLAGSLGAEALPVGSAAAVTQGLDRDQISAVIARNHGQIRFCYEQGLLQDASLAGRVTVDFTIGANGLVKAASISQSTLKNSSVEECIVQSLRSWKFPLPDGGVDVKVLYPFTLRRAGQG